jgi:hypothetical protein
MLLSADKLSLKVREQGGIGEIRCTWRNVTTQNRCKARQYIHREHLSCAGIGFTDSLKFVFN